MTLTEVPSILLRRPADLWAEATLKTDSRRASLLLFAISMVGFTIYGAVLGISNGPIQAIASAAKLPALFLLTMAISFPVLHVLNLLFGGQQKASELTLITLIALAATATILVAFAPISLFFLVTGSGYSFYRLLNVAILGIASVIGFRLFVKGCNGLDKQKPDAQAPNRKGLLRTWVLLVAFVGCQLSWTMRPFFGSPDLDFAVFRKQEGNFYQSMGRAVYDVFGGEAVSKGWETAVSYPE
jgi:hypothetical protein